MKLKISQKFIYLMFLATASLGCSSFKNDQFQKEENITYPDEQSISLSTFQDSLSDYGQWVPVNTEDIDPEYVEDDNSQDNVVDVNNSNEDEYQNDAISEENSYVDPDVNTEYIWVPYPEYVNTGWNPYTEGRWTWTSWGWEWISDCRWSSVTYHYGRWWHSRRYGWVWSPGRKWASSWVDWCYYDGYNEGYNEGYQTGYSEGYSEGYWEVYNNGYVGWHPSSPHGHHHHHGGGNPHPISIDPWWVFTKRENFTKRISTSVIDSKRYPVILKNSKSIDDLTQIGKRSANPTIDGKLKTDPKRFDDKKVSLKTTEKWNLLEDYKNSSINKSKQISARLDESKTMKNNSTIKNGNVSKKDNTSIQNKKIESVNMHSGIQVSNKDSKTKENIKYGKETGSVQNKIDVLKNKDVTLPKEKRNTVPEKKSKSDFGNSTINPPKVETKNTSKVNTSNKAIQKDKSIQKETRAPKINSEINSEQKIYTQPKVNSEQKVYTQPKENNSQSRTNYNPPKDNPPKIDVQPKVNYQPKVEVQKKENTTQKVYEPPKENNSSKESTTSRVKDAPKVNDAPKVIDNAKDDSKSKGNDKQKNGN